MKWMGEKIKDRADEQGLSISKLSKSLGVSRQSVNDWIGGKLPRGNHLVALCRTLQVSPNYFFSETIAENIVVPVHRMS